MKDSYSRDYRKIDDLKPKMTTLEKLEDIEITPNHTLVTAKLDGEFTLLVFDRNTESYTLNKWGHRRSDFPALNQLIEKMNETPYKHVEFLCELYAFDTKPLRLPQFISLTKGEHQDLTRIHIAIFDLLSIDGKNITQHYTWKMQEVETWIKGCTQVAVVPCLLPRTQQDVKDFWNEYALEKGYEGLVIRNGNRTYKIKPTLEVDAVVIGLNKKTSYGKALDLFQREQITSIKLALMQPDGTFLELSDCASGITADLRTALWKLMEFKVSEDDKTVYIKPIAVCAIQYTDTYPKRRAILKLDNEYKWRGWTKFVSLREPRLIRFRPDKAVNPQDLRLTQIPQSKITTPQSREVTQMSEKPLIITKEEAQHIPRIVRPAITSTRFSEEMQKLHADKWLCNLTLRGNTPEEAVEIQAREHPAIEFQPVKLDDKWVAFRRTSVEDYLKAQEQKPTLTINEPLKPESQVIRVKGETADQYWQRNNTCVTYLKRLILAKIPEDQLRKMTFGCHNIEGITEEFMEECWRTGIEHPEWFGHSDYYIKPYLALAVKLGLGEQAYQYLNEGTAFPRKPPEDPTIEVSAKPSKQTNEEKDMSYPVETDQHGNAIPPTELGGLQPQVVQKPKVLKCPKCGSSTFDLISEPFTVVDMLSFDDETGKPFISLMNLNEAMREYTPQRNCQRVECSECGEPIPKEWLKDLPEEIETDVDSA